MPSVIQLKKEITSADYFNAEQKKWLLSKIDFALNQIAIRKAEEPKQYKKRSVKNAQDFSLFQWEEKEACRLNTSMIIQWVRQNKLCPRMVSEMLDEFRVEMMAKGKRYADFRMAFQTYLRKGYLSKSIQSCALDKSPYRQETVIETKGVTL